MWGWYSLPLGGCYWAGRKPSRAPRGRYSGRDPKALPALVLLDLKLPQLDGFEVLRRIREDELTKLISPVVTTCSREGLDRLGGYRLGANSNVRKTVIFDQFLSVVRQLRAYWLRLNEPVPNRGVI